MIESDFMVEVEVFVFQKDGFCGLVYPHVEVFSEQLSILSMGEVYLPFCSVFRCHSAIT